MITNYSGNGKKIRRQYINGALFYYYSLMLYMPLFLLIIDKINNLERFNVLEAFSMYGYMLLLTSPLLLISILNRNIFGTVVCIVDEYGIHHGKRFVPWEKIQEIKYEIVLPNRRRKVNPFNPYEIHACHAYVICSDCKFKIMYAPHFILQIVRKYNNTVKIGFSKESKNIIAFALCLPLLIFVFVIIENML